MVWPKHILNNTLSVSLSISSLLCQYLWSWGGNTGRRRCQTRRRRRTSPPSWSRRVTGRSWRRRWEMILGFFYPSWTHSRWKLAVKLVSFHCADSRHLFDFLLSVSPKIYTDYNTPSWSRGWRRAAGRTRWRGSARTWWRNAASTRSLSRTWSRLQKNYSEENIEKKYLIGSGAKRKSDGPWWNQERSAQRYQKVPGRTGRGLKIRIVGNAE